MLDEVATTSLNQIQGSLIAIRADIQTALAKLSVVLTLDKNQNAPYPILERNLTRMIGLLHGNQRKRP